MVGAVVMISVQVSDFRVGSILVDVNLIWEVWLCLIAIRYWWSGFWLYWATVRLSTCCHEQVDLEAACWVGQQPEMRIRSPIVQVFMLFKYFLVFFRFFRLVGYNLWFGCLFECIGFRRCFVFLGRQVCNIRRFCGDGFCCPIFRRLLYLCCYNSLRLWLCH